MVNNLVFWVAKTFIFHGFGGSWYIYIYGCFLKWWVSPTIPWVFLLKMINYGVFWGYHHFRKPPYDWIANWNKHLYNPTNHDFFGHFSFELNTTCLVFWDSEFSTMILYTKLSLAEVSPFVGVLGGSNIACPILLSMSQATPASSSRCPFHIMIWPCQPFKSESTVQLSR